MQLKLIKLKRIKTLIAGRQSDLVFLRDEHANSAERGDVRLHPPEVPTPNPLL